jgi:hypothetical protein
MRGFEGSSEKHATDQRVTGQRATFGFGFGLFVEPLTPGTLPLCGIPHPIKSKLRSGIEPFWGQSSNVGLHLKVGLSPRMEQKIRRIYHESF